MIEQKTTDQQILDLEWSLNDPNLSGKKRDNLYHVLFRLRKKRKERQAEAAEADAKRDMETQADTGHVTTRVT